jgi:hypothetical protein
MTKGSRLIPEYNYSDLPEDGPHIRLLKLEPGEKEDYIHCHLEPTSLADARGTYECKSNDPRCARPGPSLLERRVIPATTS